MVTAASVSQVQPDGSVTALNPEPNAQGERAVDGFNSRYSEERAAEATLDKRLEEIFDKNNPDGGEEKNKDDPNGSEAAAKKAAADRDAQGRFKAKEDEDKTAEGAADKAKPTEVKTAVKAEDKVQGDKPQDKVDGQDKPATVALPRSWSPDDKPLWDSLDPKVQQKIADREVQVHSEISRQGQVLAAFRPLGELLNKSKDVFARHNAPPLKGIANLIELQRKIDADPPATIAAIAKYYKVPLRTLVGAYGVPKLDQNGRPLPPDPREQELGALKGEVTKLSRRLEGRELAERQSMARAEQAAMTEVVETVQTWGSDKPYFEHVRDDMAYYVENGSADDLDQAYEMACYANPTIRAQLEADKAKAAETKAKADAEAKAKADREARDKHASEARRTRGIQVDGSFRTGERAKPAGDWNDDSYLGGLYDRVHAGSP